MNNANNYNEINELLCLQHVPLSFKELYTVIPSKGAVSKVCSYTFFSSLHYKTPLM
jgi:hypothetical protein